MISDESKLHCGCEAGFRQATSYRIHCFSGGGNLALSHSGGTKKEWKALNLRGFPKIEMLPRQMIFILYLLRRKY